MKKKVNIYPQNGPITAFSIPIRSNIMGAEVEVEDIKKVLMQGGVVKEVLPDGSTYTLTLNNYDDPDIFGRLKREKEAEEAKIAQQRIEEQKRNNDIAKKNFARDQAIAKMRANVAGGAVKPPAKEEVIKKIAVQEQTQKAAATNTASVASQTAAQANKSAVEAARAKIEENKQKKVEDNEKK